MSARPEHDVNEEELIDNYITRGFEAKADGKLEIAARYFAAALEMQLPKDLEAMLAMDLFAMLRELGQYGKAKECLVSFEKRNYSGLSRQMALDIKISLKHLDILQELLTKANTPNLPFSKIPALIMVSAEEKVNQWKNENF